MTLPHAEARPLHPGPNSLSGVPLRLLAAALAVGIAAIHVVDQGGFPGTKTPSYVGAGYYLLELSAVVLAVLVLRSAWFAHRYGWFAMVSIAVGPLLGFVLSRGPGLPGYTEDRGNWTEPIGILSLVVEGSLLALAGFMVIRSRRSHA